MRCSGFVLSRPHRRIHVAAANREAFVGDALMDFSVSLLLHHPVERLHRWAVLPRHRVVDLVPIRDLSGRSFSSVSASLLSPDMVEL
jgi:hypothetical protein